MIPMVIVRRPNQKVGMKEHFIRKRCFSLIELLVVIAILAILMSLLSPSLRSAVYNASNTACRFNMKTVVYSMSMYADDNADFYPNIRNPEDFYHRREREYVATIWHWNSANFDFREDLYPYLDSVSKFWACPAATNDPLEKGPLSKGWGYQGTVLKDLDDFSQKSSIMMMASFSTYFGEGIRNHLEAKMNKIGDIAEQRVYLGTGTQYSNQEEIHEFNMLISDVMTLQKTGSYSKFAHQSPGGLDDLGSGVSLWNGRTGPYSYSDSPLLGVPGAVFFDINYGMADLSVLGLNRVSPFGLETAIINDSWNSLVPNPEEL